MAERIGVGHHLAGHLRLAASQADGLGPSGLQRGLSGLWPGPCSLWIEGRCQTGALLIGYEGCWEKNPSVIDDVLEAR